jgi:hypothetical protein
MEIPMKTCPWCAEKFAPRVARQKYCTRKHKHMATKDRRRGGDGTRERERSTVSLKGLTPAERKAYAKECSRRERLKAAGWTPETFASAKHEQSNRCAICGETPEIKQKDVNEALVPDHKHSKPPVPRALLCPGCNAGLGFFKERPEALEAAAQYLRKFSQPIGADLSKPLQPIEENL